MTTERRASLDRRDMDALHRVLDWLAMDDARTARIDYDEGEVRLCLEQPKRRGETEDAAYVGQSSDFAGAVDDCESDGWRP